MQQTRSHIRAPHLGINAAPGEAAQTPRNAAPPLVRTYTTAELFGPQAEVLNIAHRGERYSLRITSLGKLILTK